MGYYDLSKEERAALKGEIEGAVERALHYGDSTWLLPFFGHEDIRVRKLACGAVARRYHRDREDRSARAAIVEGLETLYENIGEEVRQTAIATCGEIAAKDFSAVEGLLVRGMHDRSPAVREAMTGALREVGRKNPSILRFCERHIVSPEPEVRRLICQGLELRGRTHPWDVMGLLRKLQYDDHPQVRETLLRVLGRISCREGCFHYVAETLSGWENKDIYAAFREEAVAAHRRYARFAALSPQEVAEFFDGKEKGAG